MASKPGRRAEKKAVKTPETAETFFDALETLVLGNPIDENTL